MRRFSIPYWCQACTHSYGVLCSIASQRDHLSQIFFCLTNEEKRSISLYDRRRAFCSQLSTFEEFFGEWAPIMMGNVFLSTFENINKRKRVFLGRAQGSSRAIFELVLWDISFAELRRLIRKTRLSLYSVGLFHSVWIYMLM